MNIQHKACFLIGSAAVLAVAMMAFASPAPAAEGPNLAPAEYKPLPVGTKVRYDIWSYVVSRNDGFEVAKKTNTRNFLVNYAVFGKQGENVYTPIGARGTNWVTNLDEGSRSALAGLWPLEVGKKAKLNFEEFKPSNEQEAVRIWDITIEVTGTAFVEFNGLRYPTYVVREHAVSEQAADQKGSWNASSQANEYWETKWFNPDSGLILKFDKERVRGHNQGTFEVNNLITVTFPEGTTTHAMKGSKIPTGGAPDKALLAEVERLKKEAVKAEKTRDAEIARLKKEAEKARKSGGSLLAAASGNPTLPPAEYKPLPEGTFIVYNNRTYTVVRSDGFLTIFNTLTRGQNRVFLSAHALFGEYADNIYTQTPGSYGSPNLSYEIISDEKKKLEGFWPLKVGNKVRFGVKEETSIHSPFDAWTITLKVSKTEAINLNGIQYPTYVIEERGESNAGKLFTGRKWYQPDAGLIIKAERVWEKSFSLGGAFEEKDPRFAEGEQDNYSLKEVTYPGGTTTHALKGTKTPTGGAPDKALLAEVERLKKEAETDRKAREEKLARLMKEAEKARAAEVAKLKQESEEARAAEIARLKREAEAERKAREEKLAQLRKEAEKVRLVEIAKLKQEAEKAEKARAAEIARLQQKAKEAWKAIETRQAQEAEAAKAREAEITRLKKEAEKARQAALAGGNKASAAEIARLRQEVEERYWISVRDSQDLASVEDYLKRYPKGRYVSEAKARVAVLQRLASASRIDFGDYHALVIGINEYKHLPKLQMAAKDAEAVAKVLKDDYGFKVTLLIDPVRSDIVDAFDEMQETLTGKDNLLIYYAGHGWLNEEVDRGYWLPVDAKPKRRSRWISNATITDTLKGLSAKHVMVVADSCYSGTLTRAADVGTRKRGGDYWQEMASKWARVAITSGGLEPVADKGGGDYSAFAKAFIDTLKDNGSVMDGTTLFSKMRRPVMVAVDQTPQYSDVRGAGHDGGDFIFVRKKK